MVVLGKRQWRYECRSQDFEITGQHDLLHRPYAHEQNEWLFKPTLSILALSVTIERSLALELQALIDAGGFVYPAGVVVETKIVDREDK